MIILRPSRDLKPRISAPRLEIVKLRKAIISVFFRISKKFGILKYIYQDGSFCSELYLGGTGFRRFFFIKIQQNS